MLAPHRPLWHLRKAFWTTQGSARRWAYLRTATLGPIASVRVPHTRLRVDLRDAGIGFPIYRDRSYEPDESRVFAALTPPGGVVLDIGANLGYFTTLFAKRAGHVYAIEPTPATLALLRQNVAPYPHVTVIPTAIGDRDGTTELFLSPTNAGDHNLIDTGRPAHHTVRVATVDTLMTELGVTKVDLIKLDIQGSEVHAFRGMTQTLRANPHAIIVAEYWPSGLSRAGVTLDDWIAALGPADYTRITADGERPVTLEAIRQCAPAHYESLVMRRH